MDQPHIVDVANVYGAHPSILVSGDAHQAPRRVGTVQGISQDLWITLGRTTSQPPSSHPSMRSPVEHSCQLDREGWWSTRFQHTLSAAIMGNDTQCPHYGELCQETSEALLQFWEDHKYG